MIGDGVGGDSAGCVIGDGDGRVGVGGGRYQATNLKDFQTDLDTTLHISRPWKYLVSIAG